MIVSDSRGDDFHYIHKKTDVTTAESWCAVRGFGTRSRAKEGMLNKTEACMGLDSRERLDSLSREDVLWRAAHLESQR